MAAATAIISLVLPTIDAVAAKTNDSVKFQWQILTSQNFSSQIRLHTHVLLFITVPWCGESRSLMNEISQKLAKDQQKYSSLKLMLVNRNLEKTLANSLGAAEGITVLCYRNAISYRYQGILREQDILSSVYYLMSLAAEDLPLKKISNSEDLEVFLASTDKTVILLESCGWTPRLVVEQTDNETVQGGIFPRNMNRETNQTLSSGKQKNLKDVGNDMNCDIRNGCGDNPWVGDFSAENGTASLTTEDLQSTSGISCSFEEYRKFKSFFSKFMVLGRDIYLPPQRQRFGFVSDRSLLWTLGIEDPDQWSLIISYAGCPNCLKIFKEGIHLQKALEIHDLPVMELPDDGTGQGPSLPVEKPSVILFVDRTSDSLEIRKRSQEALHAFRELALQYWKSYPMDWQSSDLPKRSLRTYQGSASMFKNHRLLLSPSSQMKLKDKMSIMIINEGKQVTFGNEASNLQSGSLQEILKYLAGQKKQSKLSSLAKEAGFQLLSDEIEIKIANVLSNLEESQNQDSSIKLDEVSEESVYDKNKDFAPLVDHEQQFQSTNVETPYEYSNQKVSINSASGESGIVDPHQSLNEHEIGSAPDVDLNIQTGAEKTENSEGFRHHFSAFTGSFFFCDGKYKFLRSLTNSFQVPRVVIIDPLSEQYYVLPEEANYSVTSVSTFLGGFLNGSLTPYQRSGPLRKSIEIPQPPFVNLDFHEKDSIPIVTPDTFSELVLGSGESDAQYATNAWHKDVVVLFSSSWCGFCQRMELVVREVYRALKGYIKMVESESKSKKLFSEDNLKDVVSKMPAFYLIDCTLNECSWILKSLGQKEVFPSLLLFPAERKIAIGYNGNMMVTDIIKFIANHGSTTDHLTRHKGTLWTDWEEEKKRDDNVRGAILSEDTRTSSDVNNEYFGSMLQNTELQNSVMFKLNEKTITPNPAVGSFLVAKKLLHESHPFNQAKILIVGADHGVGFQGLIVNKPFSSWDSFPPFQDAKLLEVEGAPISFGGPVVQQEMPVVSLMRTSFNELYPQVLPGVYFLNQLETLSKIKEVKAGNQSATDLWFFWGYWSWSWDQLLNEIAEGVWRLHDSNTEELQWPK